MATLRQKMEMASAMFGSEPRGYAQQAPASHQTRITAVAAADSESGEVDIQLPDDTVITVPTIAPVKSGEPVVVEIQNTKAIVVGKPGWGDELRDADKDIRAELTVAEDSISAVVEATAPSGGSAGEAYSIGIPAKAAALTGQRIYGAYRQDGTPAPDDPKEIRTVSSPVIDCLTAHAKPESGTSDDYWYNRSGNYSAPDDEGWVHLSESNTTAENAFYYLSPRTQDWPEGGRSFIKLVEIRNLSADGRVVFQSGASNAFQVSISAVDINRDGSSIEGEYREYALPMLYRTTYTGERLSNTRIGILPGVSVEMDIRISFVEDYAGCGYLPEGSIGISLDRPNILTASDTCPELSKPSIDGWSRGEWSSRSGGNGTRKAVDIADPPIPGIARGYQITGNTSGNADVSQSGIPLERGRTYMISCWARSLTPGATTRLQMRVFYQDSATTVGSSQFTAISSTLDDSWHRVTVAFRYHDWLNPDDKPLAIFFGTLASAESGNIQMCGFRVFEHVGTIPIDLQGNTVAALPDGTRDVLAVDGEGAVTLTKNVGDATFDGSSSEAWTYQSAYQRFYATLSPSSLQADTAHNSAVCDALELLQYQGTSKSEGFTITADSMFVARADATLPDIQSADAWSAWLAANPVTVLYPLATPVAVSLGTVALPELPDEDLVWSVAASLPASGDASWVTYFGRLAGGDYASKAEVEVTEGRIMESVSETYTTRDEFTAFEASTETTAQGIIERVAATEQGVIDNAGAISTVSGDLEDYKDATNATIGGLQSQLDGQIEAWYYSVDPTLSNAPAVDWTTEELRERHRGDLYYNVESGHSWRWMHDSGAWAWQRIPDSDAAAALAEAQAASSLAGQKRRIFTTTPTAPYDVGDMWIRTQGGATQVWYATQLRTGDGSANGSYHEEDWELSDTVAQAAKDAIDGLEVGGRNLLRNTAAFTKADLALQRASYIEPGIAKITPTTSQGNAKYRSTYLPYEEYGSGEFTVSVDARISDAESAYTDPPNVGLYIAIQPISRDGSVLSGTYDKYCSLTTAGYAEDGWVRYSATWTVPEDLTRGADSALAAGSCLVVQFTASARKRPLLIRRPKLERGNRATDWTPAPEDMADAAEFATYVTENNAVVQRLAASIVSAVSSSTSYTAPDGTIQTNALATKVTQNASSIITVIEDVDGVQTMIREFQGGVLVGKPPTSGTTSICALVNADGSFDAVKVTWSNTSGEWEPQSYMVLSTQDENGMAIYDGSGTGEGNEVARFGADGFSLFGGLGKFSAETLTSLGFKRFILELKRTSATGKQAYTRMILDDRGGFTLRAHGFDDAAGSFTNGASISTRTNNFNVDGWNIHAAKNIKLNCYETDANGTFTYHPITVNNHDLVDFPESYRVAPLGEAIPNVTAKPSDSARVLGWSYQKYASGLAHMWGVMPFNGAVATSRGNMFMSASDLCSAFPFDVSRILSFQFGQAFASDYTWGLTAWPHLSSSIWQAGNNWGINWRAAAPLSGTYGGYIPVDVWAYVE